jgi:predicted amino acid-binding ACT domain protein
MAATIRRVDYYYATVKDEPGEAYKLLATLAELGVNLLAFTAVPIGPMHTQLGLFPDDARKLASEAGKAGLRLDGPNRAFLIQGEDRVGALAEVHVKLYQAGVNIYASVGVADGKGGYGYLVYVRPEAFERAAQALAC